MAAVEPEFVRSTYSAQLARGFRWLRFDDALERRFREAWVAGFLPRLRVNIVLGIFIYGCFGFIDLMLLPQRAGLWSLAIRLFGVTPPVLATLAMTYVDIGHRRLTIGVMACMILAGWGLIAIAAIVTAFGTPIYFASLGLIAMYVYFMSGLLFYEAVFCGLSVIAAMIVVGVITHLPPLLFTYHLLFLVIANVFGMVGCYALETANRNNFLRTGLLNDLAERDGLTGVHNRGFFDRTATATLNQAIRERVSVAMMMIDVDAFKAYNDCYGHPAGDRCLIHVAGVLAGYAQRPLDVVARYGGEEFAVLWFGIGVEDARDLCEQARTAVAVMKREQDGADAGAGAITISVGAAVTVPPPGLSLSSLIRHADQALYKAKGQGRNCCVVEEVRWQSP